MRRCVFGFLFLLVFALALPASAHGSTMTYLIDFSVYDYFVPDTPFASGSFTVTLDTTQRYTDASSGLTINSFTYSSPYFTPPTSAVFSYWPDSDTLTFAGVPFFTPPRPTDVHHGLNNFFLGIGDFSETSFYSGFSASTTADVYIIWSNGYRSLGVFSGGIGKVTVTPMTSSPVPEPSSLALLGTGMIGAFTTARRKLRKATPETRS